MRDNLGPVDLNFLNWLQAFLRGDRQGELTAMKEVARLVPGSAFDYQVGLDALLVNHPRETIKIYLEIDPLGPWLRGWYPYWNNLSLAYHMLGKHKKELDVALQGREQHTELFSTLSYELRARAALGQLKKIDELLDESLILPPQGRFSPASLMLTTSAPLRAHGHKDKALQILRRAITLSKNQLDEVQNDTAHRTLVAQIYYAAEMWDEAQELFEELHTENPDEVVFLGYLGTLAARKNNRDKAMRIAAELEDIEQPYIFGEHTYWRACIAALLNDREVAVNLLLKALNQGLEFPQLIENMDLENLTEYQPFQKLMQPKD